MIIEIVRIAKETPGYGVSYKLLGSRYFDPKESRYFLAGKHEDIMEALSLRTCKELQEAKLEEKRKNLIGKHRYIDPYLFQWACFLFVLFLFTIVFVYSAYDFAH